MTKQENLEQLLELFQKYQDDKEKSKFYSELGRKGEYQTEREYKEISENIHNYSQQANRKQQNIRAFLNDMPLKNRKILNHLFAEQPDKFQKYLEDAIYTFQWEEK